LSGFTLSDLFVTNSFSAPVTIGQVNFTIGNGINYNGTSTTSSNEVVLDFRQFLPAILTSGSAQATITVVPQGSTSRVLTNAVFAIAPSLLAAANTAATNVLVQVTNSAFVADLAVSISGFGQGILAGDFVSYTVGVTNRGPSSVPNVFLTNTLPPGTALIGISPTNRSSTLHNDQLVLGLGTLTNSGSFLLHLTVQPTNSGPQIFSASVGAAALQDSAPANNVTKTNVDIGAGMAGLVIATNASSMVLNPQVGLMEQMVRLVNISTTQVASVRLTVSGLTNWLYNAVGTNNSNPFVVYANPLNPNQTVDLILEYFVPTRRPVSVPNSSYTALGVPAFNLTASSGTNGSFAITRVVLVSSGKLLIEFPSIPGAAYSIIYSTNAAFSESLLAHPAITAPADRVQWIDDGPPNTASSPSSAASRFYRVIKN
jgi:uncharacterized repeat protein (TIGR01451 family)